MYIKKIFLKISQSFIPSKSQQFILHALHLYQSYNVRIKYKLKKEKRLSKPQNVTAIK